MEAIVRQAFVVPPTLLGLVVRDALALFTGSRARKRWLCAGNCGWLFIDESRDRPRRWRSMTDGRHRAKSAPRLSPAEKWKTKRRIP